MNKYFRTEIKISNKFNRMIWNVAYFCLFRPFPSKIFKSWRNLILIVFGAKIDKKAHVYASAKIWAPWNLELKNNATIGPNVTCYNVDKVILHENVTISQNAHICTASHNIYSKDHELITAPVILMSNCWIGADAFVNLGVIIGEGAVLSARAYVYKDVPAWNVVGGNPAVFIKKRSFNNE